jgi:alpha-ketoglutarate-dependent 2,4-dichlorophenoxyacetate dioxygenase
MDMTVAELHPLFAAELSGIDVSTPLSAPQIQGIRDALLKYAVVVFRNQTLTDEQQVAFAKQFGVPESAVASTLGAGKRMKLAEMVDISNLRPNGALREPEDRARLIGLGNQLWHQDSAFRQAPAAYSMLFAHVIPGEGGDTEFCDMRAAYDDLPAGLKAQIKSLSAAHEYAYSRAALGFEGFSEAERAALPPVSHPLVVRHPETGRESLFVGCYASEIIGWPVAEGRLLLLDLMLRAAQRKFVYAHEWRRGDFVIWDNRCTMHRGRPFDETKVRDLRRVTTADMSRRAEPVA